MLCKQFTVDCGVEEAYGGTVSSSGEETLRKEKRNQGRRESECS